jgi:hypothetical protein
MLTGKSGSGTAMAGIALSLLTGCAQLDSLKQALSPAPKDQPLTVSYTVPSLSPAAGSRTDQVLGGVEIRVVQIPVANPHVAYRAAITQDQQPFTLNSSPPHSSDDPVWDDFYGVVYQSPYSKAVNAADARTFVAYRVVLIPVVETVPERICFRLTLTNRTARILKIDLAPQVILDGKVWDETYAKGQEAIKNGLRAMGNQPEVPSVLTHSLSLAPGASETWEYEGPWTEDAFPAGNASGGTVVLSVPDVLVDPVSLKKENFRYIYDYKTKQFSRDATEKSSTMLLRPIVADQLNGQIFQ